MIDRRNSINAAAVSIGSRSSDYHVAPPLSLSVARCLINVIRVDILAVA